LALGASPATVTFSSPFANSNVMITIGVRDRTGTARIVTDDCFPAVSNVSSSGFMLQWRNQDGDGSCSVSGGAVTVNYIAVLVQ
jgi:hypothetical protein